MTIGMTNVNERAVGIEFYVAFPLSKTFFYLRIVLQSFVHLFGNLFGKVAEERT